MRPPPAEAPPPREMNVIDLSWTAPGYCQMEKAAALQQAQGVVRLVDVCCNWDPYWSLQLLQRAAPTLKRLGVINPREEHLRAVHAMPRLRRLNVYCNDGALAAQPTKLGALPPGHSGLRWLYVWRLSRATLQSLLRAHAGTLEELQLPVGTPGEEEWPRSCSDLPSLLQQCGLRALRRLVLRRGCSRTDRAACGEQRAAVREALALPGLQVLCSECDDVPLENFVLATRAALKEDRGAVRDPPPAAALSNAALDPPPAEAPPPREMNVDDLSKIVPGDRQEEKAAALQQAQGVVRLVEVQCNKDPAWSLQLLQRAAPTVERLWVRNPREQHLRAVHAMPRLRRLYVHCDDRALDARPPELGALPPGHSGLRWLYVWRLPRATTQSLLRAHAGTLEELLLLVGTPGEMEWPYSCSDLPSLLQQCGLRALRRLVLGRGACSYTADCGEQRAGVREALPGLQVLCSQCDHVQAEDP